MKRKIVRWLLVAYTVLALLSAICFGVQGGFGAGHGDLDLVIFLAGMPWSAIPWPPAVIQSDVVWLVVLPFALNIATIMISSAVMSLHVNSRSLSSGHLRRARKAWIAPARRILEHPEERQPCPERGDGHLEITTVDWPDGSQVDIHMKCSGCGASNVMTLKKRDPQKTAMS